MEADICLQPHLVSRDRCSTSRNLSSEKTKESKTGGLLCKNRQTVVEAPLLSWSSLALFALCSLASSKDIFRAGFKREEGNYERS